MSLVKVKLNLTNQQKKKLNDSALKCSSCKLNLKASQLSGSDEVQITKTQADRINKAKNGNKGLMITFSKNTLKSNQKGGFLGSLLSPLLKYILPAAIPTILENTVFKPKDQTGQGCNCGNGLYSFGEGYNPMGKVNAIPMDGNGLYNFGEGVLGLKKGKGMKWTKEMENQVLSDMQGNGLYPFGAGISEPLFSYNNLK